MGQERADLAAGGEEVVVARWLGDSKLLTEAERSLKCMDVRLEGGLNAISET
jgi:hypothetical protein